MHTKLILIPFLLFFFSCEDSEKNNVNITSTSDTTEVFEEVVDSSDPNHYTEFHDNGQLKIEGNYDNNGLRTGRWISYYENGITWSESYYIEGRKDGHSVTFFPNGKVRYIGEYKDDKMFGRWTFKDEEGNIIDEKTY